MINQTGKKVIKLVNCSVLDASNEKWNNNTSIVIENGIITHVGKEIGTKDEGRAEEVMNLKNKYVIPGLIDLHTHIAFDGSPGAWSLNALLKDKPGYRTIKGAEEARKHLMAGFTTIRELGSLDYEDLNVKRAINDILRQSKGARKEIKRMQTLRALRRMNEYSITDAYRNASLRGVKVSILTEKNETESSLFGEMCGFCELHFIKMVTMSFQVADNSQVILCGRYMDETSSLSANDLYISSDDPSFAAAMSGIFDSLILHSEAFRS